MTGGDGKLPSVDHQTDKDVCQTLIFVFILMLQCFQYGSGHLTLGPKLKYSLLGEGIILQQESATKRTVW